MRNLSLIDQIITKFDSTLRAVAGASTDSARANPAENIVETLYNETQKKHVTGLMRVNHVGEVCAQALYQGQALTARSKSIQEKLQQAAADETDHLMWCQQRIKELGGHTSYLNPVWYFASLTIGMIAGLAGDKINLGFLAETEHQVERHLTEHLHKIPVQDEKTRQILLQMRDDEMKHAVTAEQAGAAELPVVVKMLMRMLSRVMTTVAYRV